MKKIKIRLGVLLVCVAVLCCLLIRVGRTTTELLDWNIEALSQSENNSPNCALVGGVCFDKVSNTYLYGMKLTD